MDEPDEVNAAIWQTEEIVQTWVAEAKTRERADGARRRFMAAILPFTEQDAFTFLDLGAGTGAASRAIRACIRAAPRYSRTSRPR